MKPYSLEKGPRKLAEVATALCLRLNARFSGGDSLRFFPSVGLGWRGDEIAAILYGEDRICPPEAGVFSKDRPGATVIWVNPFVCPFYAGPLADDYFDLFVQAALGEIATGQKAEVPSWAEWLKAEPWNDRAKERAEDLLRKSANSPEFIAGILGAP